MNLTASTFLALVAATSLAGPSLAGPEDPAAMPGAASVNSALVEDLAALWKADVPREIRVSDLTADVVASLRGAGVPEMLITSFMLRRGDDDPAATMPPAMPRDYPAWNGMTLWIPAGRVTELQLTCLRRAAVNDCLEWAVKVRKAEYRFRDVGWRAGENVRVEELQAMFASAYPNAISLRP